VGQDDRLDRPPVVTEMIRGLAESVVSRELEVKNVLVAYASRMGSTREIAATIGEELSGRGFRVDLRAASSARDAFEYDAVVLGSGLYLGRWDKSAVGYLKASAFSPGRTPDVVVPERPVWSRL
jgi:flavorubredoxin